MLEKLLIAEQEKAQNELIAKFFHGLSNPSRLKIAIALLEREKSVSELVEELGMKQSQISNQLSCLKYCGFVAPRQEGKYIYYQVKDERVRQIIHLARQVVADNADHISTCAKL
jgi:DNA-binding transcriptional ArsR family regulator